ncbi:glycosyltransferase [Pseudactinotalea sp. Z1732]|uniref:glycosyltransferase n=1 Tax=Micrococcales TaxID=85006 RepID=UPI003C7B7164
MPSGALRLALISLHTSPLADVGSGDAGGMNVMLRHSADALAGLGHQVEIFTRRAAADLPDRLELPSGVVVHHLTAGPPAPAGKREHEDFIAPFGAALAAQWSDWDIVHSHHWFSGMAAQPLAVDHGRPHVQTYHSIAAPNGRPLGEGEPPEGPGRIDGERHLAKTSDAVLAVSHAEAATVTGRLGADGQRVFVVPPGVDVELFHPIEGEPRSTLVLAARLEPLKGVDLAIRALALLPAQIRPDLHVLGAPSGAYPGYDEELRALAAELGVATRLQFNGAVARARLARCFATARAVLVPSHSESYGLTALEASACGVPVIASGAGGLREAVHDGVTGLIVPSRDPQHWADAIAGMLTDPDRAAALGQQGRELALRRTWRATAQGWERVYRRLLGAGTPTTGLG